MTAHALPRRVPSTATAEAPIRSTSPAGAPGPGNPWVPLVEVDAGELVASADRSCPERRMPRGHGSPTALRTEALPEPFIGHPDTPARLLAPNPGHIDADASVHPRPDFRDA